MGFADEQGKAMLESVDKPPASRFPPTDAERVILREAVVQWSRVREEKLKALVDLLGEQTPEPRFDKWRDHVRSLKDALATFCNTQARLAQPPTEWSARFVASNGVAETAFVDAIEAAVVAAEGRDTLTKYVHDVREEIKSLETKWQSITASHRSYESQEHAVIEQVERMINEATSSARDAHTKLIEAITASVKSAADQLDRVPEGGADAADVPANNAIQIIGNMIERWQYLKTGIEDQKYRFESYFREELGTPLFLFQEFRQETQRFIDKFGYEDAVEALTDGLRGLDAIVSRGGTSSANQADAKTFAEAAKIMLQGHGNTAKNTWDDFVTKHKGKFLGPVSPDFAKALLDRETFQRKYDRLAVADLHTLAKMWRDGSRTVYGVDFSGLPPHVAETYKAALRPSLERLDAILADPVLDRFREAFNRALENASGKINYR
jgi:cell division septum initiation protein DivIVA